jgi:subtilisin family serine protease
MMRIPKSLYLLFVVALVVGLMPLTAAAQPAATIEKALLDKFQAEGTANFFVKMAVDADTSAAKDMDWAARGQYVWDALNQVANATQGPVLDYCAKSGLDCSTMLINNSVFVRGGNLTAAEGLAALPGVSYLRLERVYVLDPITGGAGINGFVSEAEASPDAVAWGITYTKADQFWAAYGLQGDGMKVANIDTGVQWNHPALDQAFACPGDPTNADCWADPSNICGGTACDNNGHGTHTMGTMVGDDDPGLTWQAGMAPNATWIACKGCETNSCSDFALTTCATWILAPGGDPANRPNVVNNSWGGGGGDNWYQSYVINWSNAGTFPAFSAGNSGSGCNSLGSPGDYQESFGSAAHDSAGNIASFSSRGPSAFGHDPYTKPNIASPGVSVCSSIPTNGWSCGYSGTSMASPHTAGAVALVWSCAPSLVGNIDATFQLLQDNAATAPAGNCGVPPDGQGNYTFGYGYLDVLAAGTQVCGGVETGTLFGHVYDQNNMPVEGATVSAIPGAQSGHVDATTDPNGWYTMELVVGTYNVTASKMNYTPHTVNGVVIAANNTTEQDFSITYLGGWTEFGSLCFDFTRIDAEYYPATGMVYVLGGRGGADGGQTYTDIYSVDPTDGTCANTGYDMLLGISNYTIVPLNVDGADQLCTFGGRNSAGTMIRDVQCFNPNTGVVTNKGLVPVGYDTFLIGGAAAVDNKAYIFGGFRNTASPYETNITFEWDPATNAWTQKGNLGQGRAYIDVAVFDGKIYGFGGNTYDGVNLVAQTAAEVFDPVAGTWSPLADLATPTGEGRAFAFETGSGYALEGKIVIAAGGIWPDVTNAALTYDVASDTYDESFPDLNVARRNTAGVFVPGNPGVMWMIGGRMQADTPPYAPAEYYEVPAGGGGPTIHVDSIASQWNLDPYGRVLLKMMVKSLDNDGNPHKGVATTAWIWWPAGGPAERTRMSNQAGNAKFSWGAGHPDGTWKICVQDLVLAGYTFVPGANDCMEWIYP